MPEAAVPVVGNVVGGLISNKAGDKAAKAQAAAGDKAAEVQKEMYDTSREDMRPFRETGVAANSKLSAMMGLGEFNRDAIRANIKSKYPQLFQEEQKPQALAAPDMKAYGLLSAVAGGMNGQKMATLANQRMSDPGYMGSLSRYVAVQPGATGMDALRFSPEDLKNYVGRSTYGA